MMTSLNKYETTAGDEKMMSVARAFAPFLYTCCHSNSPPECRIFISCKRIVFKLIVT